MTTTEQLDGTKPEHRPLRLTVASGPDRGRTILLQPFLLRIGKDASCDLVLTDGAISAVHLGVAYIDGVVHFRDLGSRNGSFHAGARFETLQAGRSATITIGKSRLEIELADAAALVPPSARTELHGLLGVSDSMRAVFTVIERAAPTDVTVLIEGETGTGKGLAAAAVHALSDRASGPFVVCDLASLSAERIEAELFGVHATQRPGAFERADRGTLVLDEVGDVPLELQARLLRVVQERQVRRIGDTESRKIDVRVVAATNRDLGDEVHSGHFRDDLHQRLSTVSIRLPALRDRPEDVPVLVERFLREASTAAGKPVPELDADFLSSLAAYDWPGNARELRNVLERAVALSGPEGMFASHTVGVPAPGRSLAASSTVDPAVPFHDAKGRLVDAWERQYLQALLATCDGNITLAARRGGLHRAHLHRLLKKHSME
jgi:DNA-binding NtrC family response regulator